MEDRDTQHSGQERRGAEVESRSQKRSPGKLETALLLAAILMLALGLRIHRIDWDDGTHLHPDERFLTMVASGIGLPDSWSQFFDTANSPLNPYNRSVDHLYYGTLPIFATRYAGEWFSKGCGPDAAFLPQLAGRLLLGAGDECAARRYVSYDGVYLVGRLLSALADVGALLFAFFVARRLYGDRVALLASALGALAVFPIQHSHFFAVDNFATFFVLGGLYFIVRASQTGGWWSFALAGVSCALAVSCKMSTWPLALGVAVAGVVWAGRKGRAIAGEGAEKAWWPAMRSVSLRLAVAGLCFLAAFRLALPYAFQGPGFFGVSLNARWLIDMGQIAAITTSGVQDLPYARQWVGRAPVLFQWVNMVVWGLGIPLGLACWAGWGLAGLEMVRSRAVECQRRPMRHLIPWLWATVFFLYQSVLWFKTMRYELPVYYVFTVFAAYAVCRLACWARKRRWHRWVTLGLLVVLIGGTLYWVAAFLHVYSEPVTRITASRWILENVPQGSALTSEAWDDSLPLHVGDWSTIQSYEHVETGPYEEDTEQKRQQMYEWLDRADYIVLASNRLYASIPRLPERYPLTVEYYRALFAGELGFELAADFRSCPSLWPFQFPDQENPFEEEMVEAVYVDEPEPPIEVRLPAADEAFSVYDHPRVLIFRKTEEYSRELAEAQLGWIDVAGAQHGQDPTKVGERELTLEIPEKTWEEQKAGGTWSDMFDRASLLNRYPGLAAIAWWLVVAALGWMMFPIAFVLLPKLRDRGYGLARVLALLFVAYVTWLLASAHVLPNTRGTILRVVALLALIGAAVGWLKRKELRRFLRARWRTLLLMEGLFLLLYVGWVVIRLLHPDLWHPSKGGEKPMEFAYLNAVIKSTWFPPYNPWFSGSYINYYYFGYVIVGSLIKLVGTVPAIGYNLAVPLLAALTGMAAFSVAYNLFGGHKRGGRLAGVMAMVFTVVLGNLGVVSLIAAQLISLGGTEPFASTIPGYPQAVAALIGLGRLALGQAFPISPSSDWWYWVPTRIIPSPGEAGAITEFPAFTFLYGDLHAHMIAFPLALAAIVLAVNWARSSKSRWGSLLLGGLVIGALRPTNTWDYPAYLVLGLAGLAVGLWPRRGIGGGDLKRRVIRLALDAGVLVLLSSLLYLPYIANYAAGYTSVEPWQGSRTPVLIYLWIHGVMLFPILTRLVIESSRSAGSRVRATATAVALGGSAVVAMALALNGVQVALVAIPAAALVVLLVLAPAMPANRRVLWLMVGLALSLSLVVEIVRLQGDIDRMNTVFKFYIQVWLLLATAGGVCLAWVREQARCWPRKNRRLWWGVMGALVIGGALFLPFGVRARAIDRISGYHELTLDGMAFLEHSSVPSQDGLRPLQGDYEAIKYLQEEIEGSPVILEGLGYEYVDYSNRVSINTGLPAVIGWRWHQIQQRPTLPSSTVDQRRADVNECYSTADVGRKLAILDQYGVKYVYLGEFERDRYEATGLAAFDQMVASGHLAIEYDQYGVTIYEVVR
jgi:YYY domain-containing protein